ncbi:MAG: segregation/condensation protein A [Methanoregulaceae archaeon]|nr:segregation/condensation protein A [Methanoregulaceae archaeon]
MLPDLPSTNEEPVEILVQMAERGEIDPWNIDIVEVTDRFLSELDRRKELDLRISGRTLFYAAVLLRMKSEYLDQPEIVEDENGEELEDDEGILFDEEYGADPGGGGVGHGGPIERLEREISRRLDRKHLRKRPITLFELIAELKNAEKEERRRQRMKRSAPELLITAEDVVGIAHDEGYVETAHSVYSTCEDWIGEGREISLREIAARLGWTLPDVYIPLLFLVSEGRLSLWQEEFFGELFIRPALPIDPVT